MPGGCVDSNIDYTIGLDLVYCRARHKIIFLSSEVSGLKTIGVITDVNIGVRIQNLAVDYVIVDGPVDRITGRDC